MKLVTVDDAQKALKELFKDALQEMLEAELDTDLGYDKNKKAGKSVDNRRNGHGSKTVRSEYGEMDAYSLDNFAGEPNGPLGALCCTIK